MINSVKIKNYLGEEVTMILRKPELCGLLISKITGLGPGKSEIRKTEIVTNDGSIYNSARLPTRNIALTLQMMDLPSVEKARHDTYKYFPIKSAVTMTIETDERICEITGYVESNGPSIFEQKEYTQISIICPDPYFYKGGPGEPNVTMFFGVDSMFEFPFSNESLTEPLIIMGEIIRLQERVVVYEGDSEVGMTIIIDAIGTVTNVIIYNVRTRETMKINTDRLALLTGQGIVAGDKVIISTVKGSKSITLLRDGVYTNILNVLDKNSDWFQLAKGENIFAFDAEYGIENLLFRIENRTTYEGV